MKILQVITSLRIGGAEKLITEISPLLRDRGHEVDVLAFDGIDTIFKKKLIDAGIKVFSFGEMCNLYNPMYIFSLARIIKHYDIVHTHNTAPQVFTAIGNIFGSVKLVTTEHNTTNRRRKWRLYAWLDKWIYNQYKAIIAISEKTEENLKNYIGSTKSQVITIHNGISVLKFCNASLLTPREVSTKKTIITMVAAFREQKDHETLIRAMKHLDLNKYVLWLVGDGQRLNYVIKFIADQGLNENVRLWGNRSDIPSILKTSDIVVMSSHWEGFGLAAVEGMAAKKPVIASDVDGLSQVVAGAGILFNVGDDRMLADIINTLTLDNKYYDEIAERCLKRAANFDINKMVDSYLSVYESLCK